MTIAINMYEVEDAKVVVFIKGKKAEFKDWQAAFKHVRDFIDQQTKLYGGK